MKLETRLIILLGSLLALFLCAIGILHWAQRHSAFELQTQIAEDKARQLASLITLSGRTLERYAADYTQWDEMCAFIESHDPAWATINLEQSLTSWNFQGIWVFDPDSREVYRHLRPPFATGDLPAFPTAPLVRQFCIAQPLHFFTDSPLGLLEVRTAPIHPSDETRNGEPPRGWLVVARLWEAAQYAQLGTLTESAVALGAPPPEPPRPESAVSILVGVPLLDWSSTAPVHQLWLRHTSPLLANMAAYDADETVLFLAFGLTTLGLAAWFVHRWVRRPLHLIQGSLEADVPALAEPLLARDDEFARIAALIRTASEQQSALRREVEERTRAETKLRHAIAERAALGRDLHDGVIQSIYAIGMSLQGVVTLLHTAPRQAHHILETCIDGLNHSIAQLRAHIAGLETDGTPPASLAEGLQSLLRELRPARAINYDVRLDPLLAAALPQDSIAQLLFIAREALSNSLRHSKAHRIALVLGTVGSEPTFTIEDDGCGFDPEATTGHRGHGLDNMTRRAEEIGATLTIESVPGRGTRLRVELPQTGLAPETAPSTVPSP
jgi:signal transduction histidine kinase